MKKQSDRERRGLRATLCGQCDHGIGAGEVKTFDPKCAGCHEKVAKGWRTGNEPAPSRRVNEKWVDYSKIRKQLAAKAKAMAEMAGYR